MATDRGNEQDRDRPSLRPDQIEGRGHPNEDQLSEHPDVEAEDTLLTAEGDLAISGGKLPGNHDDFEGELNGESHPVPGADKKHHPAHAMSKGETKHLGI